MLVFYITLMNYNLESIIMYINIIIYIGFHNKNLTYA